MAPEVPKDMLGPRPRIALWVTVSMRRDGELVQVDRACHLSLTPFLSMSSTRRSTQDIRPMMSTDTSSVVEAAREYRPAHAKNAALSVLPDGLTYDRDHPVHYPNGRSISDDI